MRIKQQDMFLIPGSMWFERIIPGWSTGQM